MAAERNKRRSGKFFVAEGPVLGSCKRPLTRKVLSNLCFRKMKAEEHIVSDLVGYTCPTVKRRMRSPYISPYLDLDYSGYHKILIK